MADTRLYWHKVMTDEGFKELQRNGLTWGNVMQTYKQPDWCEYPEALAGEFGCWSLVGRLVHNIADCATCELCKPEQQLDNPGE